MPKDIEKLLTERFTSAIRKSFAPCPLIGPKWFRLNSGGRPADFQFVGLRKLAKAIGRGPKAIGLAVMRNLDLHGLGVADVKLTGDDVVNVFLQKAKSEG